MNDEMDDRSPNLGIGQGTLARVVRSSLDIMEQRLREYATDHGGTVPLDALGGIRQAVDPAASNDMQALISSGWRDLAEAAEREYWESQRKFPLERLIVQRFDHQLAPHGEAPLQGHTLSRRVIPAFIAALQQMIGPELYDEYENRCQAIVDETRDRMGDSFAWTVVYADPGAHVLVTDILVYIARYFDDVEKRRHWMEDFFDRVMPHAKTAVEQRWTFQAAEFHLLMDTLYQDLQRGLADETYAGRLKKRYGDANLEHVSIMLQNLAADRQTIESETLSPSDVFR